MRSWRVHLRDARNIVRDFFADIGRKKPEYGAALKRISRDISGYSPSGWRGGDGTVIDNNGEDYHRSFGKD